MTCGAWSWSRTNILWFFRPALRPLKLSRQEYKTHKEKIVGLEPTAYYLTGKCSTKWAKFFLKEKIAVCVFMVTEAGFEPAISNLWGWRDRPLLYSVINKGEVFLVGAPTTHIHERKRNKNHLCYWRLVSEVWIEHTTFGVWFRRSNQLSYSDMSRRISQKHFISLKYTLNCIHCNE